jgi:hypothetical protein
VWSLNSFVAYFDRHSGPSWREPESNCKGGFQTRPYWIPVFTGMAIGGSTNLLVEFLTQDTGNTTAISFRRQSKVWLTQF